MGEIPQGTNLDPGVLGSVSMLPSKDFSAIPKNCYYPKLSQTCVSSSPVSWAPDPGIQLPPMPIYFDIPQVPHTFM